MTFFSVFPPVFPSIKMKNCRVALLTLGCKVNNFETELIAQNFTQRHYSRVNFTEFADLYVINTCTVTSEADRQSRQYIRKSIKKNPNAFIVVTGCYAQIDPKACAAIPGVDLVVGNRQKLDIPTLIEKFKKNQCPSIVGTDVKDGINVPDQLLSGYEGRSRAFVQIQQGCNQGCTFCMIHTARGPSRSFSPFMIKRQVTRLLWNGYREIVLCGVDIGSYGEDLSDLSYNLVILLQDLIRIPGEFRIRLSSIDPAHISDELIELIASESVICPHLHLSMQSGNTLILKRMKRRATKNMLYDKGTLIRKVIPHLVLSADILVGFPTESKQHFEETLSVISTLEIAYPHVFTYSPRPGTPASKIPSQVPHTIKKQRAEIARNLGKKIWQKVALRQLKSKQKVLIESKKDEDISYQTGRAANYFPVKIPSTDTDIGEWIDVEITDLEMDMLIARKST